jgi:UDP-glucose 4-epimerase
MQGTKVLITGTGGFVGTFLYRYLSDSGITLTKSPRGKNRVDVTDRNSINCFGDADVIVHLAAKTSVKNSVRSPYETYRTNILGTLNMLEFARSKKITKFINVSTYVYGQPIYLPVDEKHPVNPHSPYNKSKVIAENLCENYSNNYEMDIVTLRPFNLYGPSSNPNSFIISTIRQISKNGKLILSGEKTKRDFLFIADFASLVTIILNRFPRGYNVFNVGQGISYTLEEVAQKIANILDKKYDISYEKESRPDDVTDTRADISKVCRSFGWKPRVRIDEGLRFTVPKSN